MFLATTNFIRMLRTQTVTLCFLLAHNSVTAEDSIQFNRDVRPILSEYCFACHGPDEKQRKADLRLDQVESPIANGAIVPGKADASTLVDRIESDNADEVMPPSDTGKELSAKQKQVLTKWIQQGAKYQNHWSFEPIPAVVIPPNVTATKQWVRNPIDQFVALAHQNQGLTHSPESDRATWLRRVTLDLTGLPPSLIELDEFLHDTTANAYEKVVDRLLKSPAYGERMANVWLDVARYADTFGYQSDVAMEVWPWREWVIKAFNRNLPYDQFIVEQIAGDLLPNATQEQRLATTFNRLHRQTNEGGSIPEEFRLTGIADRTTTAGTAFLGLTLECARCHDHKFDPIKTREFYQLSAYFSDIDEFGVYSHFTHSAPTPSLLLYNEELREKHNEAKRAIEQAQQELQSAVAAERKRLLEQSERLAVELPKPRGPALHVALEGSAEGVVGKATLCDGDNEVKCDKAPEFGRNSPFSFSLWVHPASEQPRVVVFHQSVAAEDSGFRGLQLTIDSGYPEFSMIHFWPGNALRVRAKVSVPTKAWSHLSVTHDGSGKASGVRLYINGEATDVDVIRDELTRDIKHRSEWGDSNVGKVSLALGARFRDVGLRDGLVDEFNIFDKQLSDAEILSLYRSVQTGDLAAEVVDQNMALEHALLTTTNETIVSAREKLQAARAAENELVTNVREIMTMEHTNYPAPTHVLHRGDYASKREEVRATTPDFVEPIKAAGEDRLALARWITDPRNPLTARVVVNRFWHLFFGRGIVLTLEDLGSQGTPPSHPELLDYLSRYLIDNKWDLHVLCRHIVLSATYRQASTVDSEQMLERDPENIWLARGPKYRLSAEQLRDTILAASGLLVNTMGGPSVMPYQPEGLWEEAGTGKTYHQSTGDGLYRRSLYTFWRRTSPPPSMLTFDATSRESCTARRELTTTPLQALVFLNDPQFIEAARVMAESLIKTHAAAHDDRWNELFKRLISRAPTVQEREVIKQLYAEQLQYFSQDEARSTELIKVGHRAADKSLTPSDLAATTIVVQTMFAYDETIMSR